MKQRLSPAFRLRKPLSLPGDNRSRLLVGFLALLVLLFLLMPVLLEIEIPQIVPYHLHSGLFADYSGEPYTVPISPISLSLIGDALNDWGIPDSQGWEATIVVQVQTPAPTVTPPSIPGVLSTPTAVLGTPRSSPTAIPSSQTPTPTPSLTPTLTPTGTQTPMITPASSTPTGRPSFSPTPTTARPRATQPTATRLPPTSPPPTDPPPTNTPLPPTPRPTNPPTVEPSSTPRPYPYP